MRRSRHLSVCPPIGWRQLRFQALCRFKYLKCKGAERGRGEGGVKLSAALRDFKVP